MLPRGLKSQVGNLLLLAIGAFFAIGALLWLDLGSARRMGPGFFPMAVGALLCVLALIAIVTSIRNPLPAGSPDPLAIASVVGGVITFAVVTPLLGVLPAVFLSVLATGSSVSRVAWTTRLWLAVLASVAVWAVFIVALQLPFVAIRGL